MADPTGANLTEAEAKRIDFLSAQNRIYKIGSRLRSLRTDLDGIDENAASTAQVIAALGAADGAVAFNSQNITGVAALTASGAITGGSLVSDTISESTGAAGVTIDGCLLKDGNVDGVDVSAISLNNMPAAASGGINCGNHDLVNCKDIENHTSSNLTVNSSTELLLQRGGTNRIQIDGTGMGFFGATPVAQQADCGALTDSTGSSVSADGTVGTITGHSSVADAVRELLTKINAIRTALRNVGIMA